MLRGGAHRLPVVLVTERVRSEVRGGGSDVDTGEGQDRVKTDRRAPQGASTWNMQYLAWVKGLRFEQANQQLTLEDYLHEVDHAAERVARLERSIDAVIETLQSLRGIAQISAVSIMAELGQVSRLERAWQLMGYSGAVSWEDSSGDRVHRGAISKAGNAHLRRMVVEAAWAYRHRPDIAKTLAARQRGLSA